MKEEIIIRISEQNPLKLTIDTEHYAFLKDVREQLTEYAPNFRFSPKYKAGTWDGKISLFESQGRLFPFGLLTEVLSVYKRKYKDVSLKIDDKVKSLFKGEIFDFNWNLNLIPRDYQEDCIKTALKYRNCLIVLCTAGGKSLILAYIWKHLYDNQLINNQLIIVPTKGLIKQFHTNLVDDYGISEEFVGEVYSEKKEWDKNIVISTWQTLSRYPEKINEFDSIFVDECHSSKAHILTQLLKSSSNVNWRIGCTGTMPDSPLDILNVKSYLGPVVKEYTAKELKERGWITECCIKKINLHYIKEYKAQKQTETKDEITFFDIKDEIFKNEFRLHTIKEILLSLNKTALVLVGKVEDEGQYLKNYLDKSSEFTDYEIVFLSGKNHIKEREKWRLEANDLSKKIIIISTYPLFQQGIDIRNLEFILFAAPSKSKIRVLQSIGRILRLAEYKDLSCVYDLVDGNNKWFTSHSEIRDRHYLKQDFRIEEEDFYEKTYLNEVFDV